MMNIVMLSVAMMNIVMLSVVMMNIVMLSVVTMNVVVPPLTLFSEATMKHKMNILQIK
jgi:hypothetical protein